MDPLRAARVSFHRERFHYFCSPECRERFDAGTGRTPLPFLSSEHGPNERYPIGSTQAETPEAQAERHTAEALLEVAAPVEPSAPRVPDTSAASEPLAEPRHAERARAPDDGAAPIDVGTLLLGLATLGSLLGMALALAGDSALALSARVVLVGVGCAALAAESLLGSREASELNPLALLSAPVAATLLAIGTRALGEARTGEAITLAALIVASTSVSAALMRSASRPLELERLRITAELDQPGHRVAGNDVATARAADLRPGEEIVIEAGETVPVDATVTAGSATVSPWFGAKITTVCHEGEAVVAGARVLEGRLRAVVGWAGFDRAWVRLTNDPRRRADLLAPLGRAGRLLAERGAPFVAGFAALAAFAGNLDGLSILLLAVAVQAGFAQPGIAQVGAVHVGRGILEALRRGIAFRSADAFDRAGKVSSTAFCARGTLLLGEPEVTNIEAFGQHEPEQVLALVAGAEAGASHPAATAVLRAARARGVRPDGVRSPSVQPGLGITAVAASGQPLVVGSRALMLRERISVAAAESRITDLEAMGRSVLLIALGGRLIGVLGLQDGLRPGARAAVQHLLDVGVEPVLLSGDARETCEAIGRALDIDHLRPEVPPAERGDEVRRLADGGATVAVVGKSPVDDAALSAADVSIALAAAGSSSAEWSIQLASDDVRDAAFAVRLAHDTRREAQLALAATLVPPALGSLVASLSLSSPALAPFAAAVGTLAAVLRLRTLP